MTSGDLPPDFPLRETVNLDYAHGGSQIVAPLGIPLVPPTSGDTILYAECQADMIKVWKAIIDTVGQDRKSTRLNSSHGYISYAVFCLKKKKKKENRNGTVDYNREDVHG